MTSDKQTHGHLAKPFTPTLSAAFHRTNKSPLTPKLAHSSPGQPAARRLAQSDHTYSTPQKDDPPPANVTPRSGSRNTRRDAAFPSPTNTPPVPSPQTPYSQPPVGLGLHAGRRAERSPARGARPEQPRSLRAKTLTADGPQSSRPNTFNDLASASPRFFHASDARSNASSEVEPPRPKPGKMSPASSFVYANGENERQSSDDAPLSTTAKRRSGGLVRPPPTSKPAASPSPRLKSPRLSDATSPPSLDSQLHCGPAPEAAEETLMRIGSPPNIPNIVPDRPHRPSIGRHTKSSSVDSSHHTPSHEGLRASPIIISNAGGESPVPVMSEQIPTLRPRVFSNGSSVSASTDAYQSMPLSPGKSDGGDALNNARTERKIMDLEISNSSLLAINRTLEREMRKQNAELRRYRRLSRSGRISMAPTTRSFSGTALSTTSEVEEGVSELSSIRTQDEFSDYSDEESMPDEGVMSPDSLAEHDAKHRAHDEKRFMLDLARHQELLVDSQKMNHSLKRCLGWTEELIKEGQRALEYSVHVQDVELGGRVLSPEELGEVGESGRGLLSPSVEYSAPFLSDDLASDALTDPATLPLPSSPGGTE
ncbi:hypothetical protein N7492_004149 [Penicillium capsulatum]|uniref:Uncharacterized protein n=1 Tax=Penicillium capsulatum TaxID=69766 RepID=A0A9W9LXL1_9EURO|nr:hypothetical protein N7492_004149 [Penicillium capsulatum]KAJ6121281.1 hypothetical protein N7512_003746 [Penicillium capsulatum]